IGIRIGIRIGIGIGIHIGIGISIGIGILIGIGIRIDIGIGIGTSALQIVDVFGCLVTRLLYRLQMCLVPLGFA
ncbi:hypothetical protein Tco_0552334, partial [Tanacetum coccineum]